MKFLKKKINGKFEFKIKTSVVSSFFKSSLKTTSRQYGSNITIEIKLPENEWDQ